MKMLFSLALMVMFVFAGTMDTPDKPITVEGTLVDSKCYGMAVAMEKPDYGIGNDHKMMKDGQEIVMPSCATACAGMGIPAGVATADGQTYVLITSSMQLKAHMAKQVRVTGEETFPGTLLIGKVEVMEDGAWKDVTPVAMM